MDMDVTAYFMPGKVETCAFFSVCVKVCARVKKEAGEMLVCIVQMYYGVHIHSQGGIKLKCCGYLLTQKSLDQFKV